MVEKKPRRRYLTVEDWKLWLGNDWKHLNWKVNAALYLLSGILITVVAGVILRIV